MGAFRSPTMRFNVGATAGRHRADPEPLKMGDEGGTYTGARRREGRHGITPSTQPENRPTPTGAPAGQHRKGRPAAPAPAGRHRAPEAPADWIPTKSAWRRLMAGETVNGYRLTRA